MNILRIIKEIEKVDPEVYERLDSRRSYFKNAMGFGKKVAAAAVPLYLATSLKKAYGQSATGPVIDSLNLALKMEYLEYYFYQQGLASSDFKSQMTGETLSAFIKIKDDEVAHISRLNDLVKLLGGTPEFYDPSYFDFTGGEGFPNNPNALFTDVFTDYSVFLLAAQTLEDMGVRAYKGQAERMFGDKTVLGAALRIHSVEARHAAHIRSMRRSLDTTTLDGLKPWIEGTDTGLRPINLDVVYTDEDNTSQAGIPTETPDISSADASAAFDEPLSTTDLEELLDLFH